MQIRASWYAVPATANLARRALAVHKAVHAHVPVSVAPQRSPALRVVFAALAA